MVAIGLIHILIYSCHAAYEPTRPSEILALKALYSSAGGSQWSAANWMSGEPCGVAPYHCGENCKGWQGVHCWGPDGHVRMLHLKPSVAPLNGVLPTELGLLTGLASLQLPRPERKAGGGGGLSGTLPSELARIPFESTDADGSALLLHGHRISGTLPMQLAANIPNDIGRCQLPSTIGCSKTLGIPSSCTLLPARRTHHGPCFPPPRRPFCHGGATGPISPAMTRLCNGLSHLGLSQRLLTNSVADTLLANGIDSLPKLIAAPSLRHAFIENKTDGWRSDELRAKRLEAVIEARDALSWHESTLRSWSSVSGVAMRTLRGRLEACCAKVGHIQNKATRGSWNSRKMHPCCAPMTSPLLTGRAVARSGDSGRINAFLAKLKRREPVTIVAVGGSISTREYAGCTSGVAEAWVGVELGPGCAPGRGWGRMALEWLNATWPPLYGEHRLIAFGRTGIAADGFVDCLTTHIANLSSTNGRTRDGPVDLFFLEFAITGASSKGDTAAPLEALVRRLLSLPGRPAILPVNFFPFLTNKEASWEMGPLPASLTSHTKMAPDPLHDFLAPYSATLLPPPEKQRRRDTPTFGPSRRPIAIDQLLLQEQTTSIYSYYSLPLISVRDGLVQAMRTGEVRMLDWIIWGDFGFHPPPALQAFVAGAIIESFRRHLISAAASNEEVVEAFSTSQRLPPAIHRNLPERHPLACYVWGLNYRFNAKHYGYRLYGPPPTAKSNGWEVTREMRTSRAGAVRVNPGLRANVTGAELVVEIDTSRTLDVTASSSSSVAVVVQLEYLASEGGGMGVLEASCLSGCTCGVTRFDAHADVGRGSRHVLGCMRVSEARSCALKLVAGAGAASGGSKFVLHALRVLQQEGMASGTSGGTDCDASLPQTTQHYQGEHA